MGRDALRLGSAQVTATAAIIGAAAMWVGASAPVALVLGGALALSSSAFVIQLLTEKGELASPVTTSVTTSVTTCTCTCACTSACVTTSVTTPGTTPGTTGELASRFGRASFAILLAQDLAVVPLLVITPLLGGSGAQLGAALRLAAVKSCVALLLIIITELLIIIR